jgi:tetratricopeptide (TPR) repeat protein
LTVRLGRAFADPWAGAEGGETPHLSGGEFFGLGRWYAAEGRTAEAEQAYRAALRSLDKGRDRPRPGQAPGTDHVPDLRARVLRTLGCLLKRAGRRSEAFACWQQLALENVDDVLAHVELAKYFEWHVGDLSLAAGWTQAAIARVENWPAGVDRGLTLAELRHRLARLERKRNQQPPGDGA